MQQFQVTFDQIKKNFASTFQTLFGGGLAELELIAAEDILVVASKLLRSRQARS